MVLMNRLGYNRRAKWCSDEKQVTSYALLTLLQAMRTHHLHLMFSTLHQENVIQILPRSHPINPCTVRYVVRAKTVAFCEFTQSNAYNF